MKIINPNSQIIIHQFSDDGTFPNSLFPLLIYRKALTLPLKGRSKTIITLLENNNWSNSWKNGIYDYHHYHSLTHEVLAVYRGKAKVQFGGPAGLTIKISKGDVIIIPAGVAHRKIAASENFKIVGAYPYGVDFDIKKGQAGDRPDADLNIRNARMPDTDPVYGSTGPLINNWKISQP